MKILIMCEEIQRVCTEFRELGYETYSVDIQTPSGGHHEWHIQCDGLLILNGGHFCTMDGIEHSVDKVGVSRSGGAAKVRSKTFKGIAVQWLSNGVRC